MKKLISFIATLTIALGLQTASAESLRIGVEGAYPPFSEVTPDGKLVGFDIDISNALCAAMNTECEMITQDWDGIIPALLAEKYDAIIASMSVTPERLETVDFTDRYYQASIHLLRKKGSGIDESKLGDKTIGVQQGTTMDNVVTEKYGNTSDIKRYPTQGDANLDAINGRIDLLALEDAVAIEFMASDDGKEWEAFGAALGEPDNIAIAIRKNSDELKAKLNKAISDIRASGQYDEIAKKYFGSFNIYGE